MFSVKDIEQYGHSHTCLLHNQKTNMQRKVKYIEEVSTRNPLSIIKANSNKNELCIGSI